jgi:hypothetical protein
MTDFKRVDIETEYVASLCWHGDRLLDVLGSGRTYHLDGTMLAPQMTRGYAYKWDSVISHGRYAVLYEAHGTKGLLVDLERSSDIRELNRPYYHANDYRYPVTLFRLPDGRDVIAHCPTEYCALDIEDILSEERLTKRDYKPDDIFHSNLAASLDGRYLLDRGWVWQPVNVLCVYDVERALKEPGHLDGDGIMLPYSSAHAWEPETAAFCGHKLVYSSFLEGSYEGEEPETNFEIIPAEPGVPEKTTEHDGSKVRRVVASELSISDADGKPVDLGDTTKNPPDTRFLLQVFDLDSKTLLSTREMPEFVGRMMPVGDSHVVSFYDHPKLLEIETGKVVHRWEDLVAGPEVFQPSVMMKGPGDHHLAWVIVTGSAIAVLSFWE